MKITESIRGVLAANRRLAHYRGIAKREGKKDRPYDIIASTVTVYRDKDGNIVNPIDTEAVKTARAERHSVAFDTETWNAIAGVACVTDTVVVEGNLCTPEPGEEGFYEVVRTDGTKFLSGDLRDPKPVAHIPGVFRGAHMRTADQIPVETTGDTEPHGTVR